MTPAMAVMCRAMSPAALVAQMMMMPATIATAMKNDMRSRPIVFATASWSMVCWRSWIALLLTTAFCVQSLATFMVFSCTTSEISHPTALFPAFAVTPLQYWLTTFWAKPDARTSA